MWIQRRPAASPTRGASTSAVPGGWGSPTGFGRRSRGRGSGGRFGIDWEASCLGWHRSPCLARLDDAAGCPLVPRAEAALAVPRRETRSTSRRGTLRAPFPHPHGSRLSRTCTNQTWISPESASTEPEPADFPPLQSPGDCLTRNFGWVSLPWLSERPTSAMNVPGSARGRESATHGHQPALYDSTV